MENQKNDILMKLRSSRSCVGTGYHLYTGNFKKIFRGSWAAALVYALLCSAAGTVLVLRPEWLLPFTAVLLVGELLFAACGFSILREHQQTGTISRLQRLVSIDAPTLWRTVKMWLCLTLVYIIAGTVVGAVGYMAYKHLALYTAMGCTAVAAIIAAMLLLPFFFIAMRYMLNRGTAFWPQLGTNYTIGLRHWGFIFVVVLMATLVQVLLLAVLTLPAAILSIANLQAQQSVALGDLYGMPSYIAALTAVTYLLIGFIQAYVQLSFLFPCYYMYGAIETQEHERLDFNNTQQ